MPSPKDPFSTIQPGPGKASDNTVSASALDFDPAAGAEAALQSHITATPAHDDAQISSGPFTPGTFWQVGSEVTVDTVLQTVFHGLNSRGMIVLDANPAATDCDYAGPSALNNAYSFSAANNKTIFYLRPGTYDWGDSFILSGVTIIGGGSPDTNVSNTEVIIRNTSGNIRIANGTVIRNVVLKASGVITLPAGNGGCTLENVGFDITGKFLNVQSSGNVFRQCGTHASAAGGTELEETAGGNLYDTFKVEQAEVTGSQTTFVKLTLAGPLAPPTSGSSLLRVSGSSNSFDTVSITHSGAAITISALSIEGSHNVFTEVQLSSINAPTVDAVRFGSGGINNSITGLRVAGTCTHLLSFNGSDQNSVRNASFGSSTITGNVINFQGSYNTVVDASAFGAVSGAQKLISLGGTGNKVSGFNALAAAAISWVVFESGSIDCSVDRYTHSSTPNSSSGPLFNINGTGNSLSQVSLNTISTLAVPMVKFTGATNCSAFGFSLVTLNVTAGVGFQLVQYSASTRCKAGDIQVSTSPNFGTTSGLVVFTGTCFGCELDGLKLNNIAGSAAINSPIVTSSGITTAERCVVRNIHSNLSGYASATSLLDIDIQAFSALRIERCKLQEQYARGTCLRLRNSSSLFGSLNLPTVVQDCDFSNSITGTGNTLDGSGHAVWISSYGDKVILDRVNMSAGGNAYSAALTSISVATPAVATQTAHGLIAGTQIYFTTNGTLPAPLVAEIPYWVIATGLTANTFQFSSTPNGTAVATTLAGSGTHTVHRQISALQVEESWHVEMRDCNITASGSDVVTASVFSAGAKFHRCVFTGPGGGTSGTQLFRGYGYPGGSSASFPQEPLYIHDCTFRPGQRNINFTAITNPMIFIGGVLSTVPDNHGPAIVDGLRVVRSTSITTWHRSPLLSMDASKQANGTQSSFSNIDIDMEGVAFGTGGGGGAVLSTVVFLNGTDTIVECCGDQSTSAAVQRTPLRNLKLVGMPRNGGTGAFRSAFTGSGLDMYDCVFDAATGGSSVAWNGPLVAVHNTHVDGMLIYPTTSVNLGTGLASSVLSGEANCVLSKVTMANFAVAAAEQRLLVGLDGSSLINSRIEMPSGSHIPTPSNSGAMIVLFNFDSDDPCRLIGNTVVYDHQGTSSGDVRVVAQVSSEGAIVRDNYFYNLAEPTAGSYSSNGGGCQISADSDGVTIADNYLKYSWATNTDNIPSITSSGSRCNITGNHTNNMADNTFNFGGSNLITVTAGLYTNVSNNVVEAYNTVAFHVLIDTSGGGGGIVIGNRVDNRSGNTGDIQLSGSDKPAAYATYNQLT